ncbi:MULTISPECIES: hypothetical protein [unclassified Sphingomonas]|uniref:hypothetical protein n=1 Tax=unclassified Sphingomonas TaxID=196159 RepID=UPI0006F23D5D|nr:MULTISPECIES: hypothetical protein [unclassified Sphingomonas]KQN07264.1 hypothetical protein ASE78_13730 [Sphingomonas sp. Leaf25]KQN34221.1 hypothetical protein ASE97_16250 [Sphingomonas sp. Leaf42]KQT30664.1 hypothetical protein ASG37_06315 [Sphingomonas sp. Leaf407]
MRRTAALFAGLTLSACATGPVVRQNALPTPPAPAYGTIGLERVMGQNATTIGQLFGQPLLDLSEGPGRKLQYGSDICVLDAYLYPPAAGGVPVVRHVDARQRSGAPIDRASCVAALTRARGGR